MQILMISGSRNRQGQTAVAAQAVLKGASDEGADTSEIYLPESNIERCRQCNADGWGLCTETDDERCVIEDDFAEVLARMRQADAIVVASPRLLRVAERKPARVYGSPQAGIGRQGFCAR